jgi:hypothetical protein
VAGYRTWTDQDRLTPEDLNTYLMGQVVARFATVADRDAQLGVAVPGMVSYIVGKGLQQFDAAEDWVSLVCPAYSTATLPAATSVQVGTAVFNTTTGYPVWSNGTAWVSAAAPPPAVDVHGTATLVAGTAVVTTALSVTSRIYMGAQTLGTVTVPSALGVSARDAGSFTILASDPTDTSTVAWHITESA